MATKALKKKAAEVTEEKTEVKKKAAAKKTAVKKKPAKTAKAKTPSKKVKSDVKEKSKATITTNSYLVIDHPIEMETIYGNHYAIRIGASTDGYVEISFNEGEWQPCRYDAGYWWFDWTYFTPGHYALKVRLMDPNGNPIMETSPRKCRIC